MFLFFISKLEIYEHKFLAPERFRLRGVVSKASDFGSGGPGFNPLSGKPQNGEKKIFM